MIKECIFMKKILALVLSLMLLLSMSVPAFAAEVETQDDVAPCATRTLIDSFNLSANIGGTATHSAYYSGYNQYDFEYLVMGVNGAVFNLHTTAPNASVAYTHAYGATAVEGKTYTRSWTLNGTYTFNLYTHHSSPYGTVIHVRVYGVR